MPQSINIRRHCAYISIFALAISSTILTTVNLLNEPLNMVGQGLPTIVAAYASMKRIQSFLELDEKRDHDANGDNDDTSEKQETQTLTVENASFSWLPDSPVMLDDINLELLPGKLHICVGPVASVRCTPKYPIRSFFLLIYILPNRGRRRS